MFGWSIHSPGDLDQDGYQDLIVAAPFEIEASGKRGAIYIYNGSKAGLRAKWSQKITSVGPSTMFGSAIHFLDRGKRYVKTRKYFQTFSTTIKMIWSIGS